MNVKINRAVLKNNFTGFKHTLIKSMGSQRLIFSSIRRIREYKDDYKDPHNNIIRYGQNENNKKEMFPNIVIENKQKPKTTEYDKYNDMQEYYSTILK